VDNEGRCQRTGSRGNRRAGGQTIGVVLGPNAHALREQFRPGSRVNRAIDPAPAHQRGVGGIDDRIGGLRGDVTADHLDDR